jgi:hypothetical protein
MIVPGSVGSIRHPCQMHEFVECLITSRSQIAVGTTT